MVFRARAVFGRHLDAIHGPTSPGLSLDRFRQRAGDR